MKLEVKVDEADVGELRTGARATFTVDAYPGRVFPATVTRVDLGANATPSVNSAGAVSAATSTVVAYTAVLSVANSDLLLKPGMTATADIVTAQQRNVFLAPNAALRFDPTLKPTGGIVMGPPGFQQAKPKKAAVGRGAHQQLYILGPDGKPKVVPVVIGDSNGSKTEVTGSDIRAGLKVITGQLAKGTH
jgi:HlyD family secretion protein